MAKVYDKMFNGGTITRVFCKELKQSEIDRVFSDGGKYNEDKTHRCSLQVKDTDGNEFWVGWGSIKIKEGMDVGLRRELAPKEWSFVNEGAKVFFFYEQTGQYFNLDKKSFRVMENGPVPEKRWTFGQPKDGGNNSGGGGNSGGGNRGDYLKGIRIGHAGTSAAIWFQRFGMPQNKDDFLSFGAFCHDLTRRLEEETKLEGAQVGHSVKNALRVAENQGAVEGWAKFFLESSAWFGQYIAGEVQLPGASGKQQAPPMNSQPVDNTVDDEMIPF